jgi:hypothetical protein
MTVSRIALAALLPLFAAVAAAEPTPAAEAPPATPPEAAAPAPPKLEPKALEILKAACDKLAAAKSLSFTATIEEEGPDLNYGLPLLFSRTAAVDLRRPDKLRVKGHGSGPATDFYYDGTTMTAWLPTENLVATMPAPSTVDAMLKDAFDKGAIYFPFEDLIVTDPYADLMDGLRVAFYIGRSDVVGGVETDMIAFGNDDAFVQAWIGTKDKLPRRLRAVYLADPAALRHDMELSDWKLNATLPLTTFVAKVPVDAGKIPFQRPAEMPPSAPPNAGVPATRPGAPQTDAPAKEDRQ